MFDLSSIRPASECFVCGTEQTFPVLNGTMAKSWLELAPCVATSLAFYRSQKGLSLENSQKSPKRGSRGLSAPGSKKLEKSRIKVENGPKTRKKLEKESFLTLFRVFSTPGPLGNPFSDFFSKFSRERPFDSCRRPTMSQTLWDSRGLYYFKHLLLTYRILIQHAFLLLATQYSRRSL